MDPNGRRVQADILHVGIVVLTNDFEDLFEETTIRPLSEPAINGFPRTKLGRQVSPGWADLELPEHGI